MIYKQLGVINERNYESSTANTPKKIQLNFFKKLALISTSYSTIQSNAKTMDTFCSQLCVLNSLFVFIALLIFEWTY